MYRKNKLKNYVKLKPLKNYYYAIFMLVLVTCLYYLKNFGVNIISLVITLAYVLIVNKDLIDDIRKIIVRRVRKKA